MDEAQPQSLLAWFWTALGPMYLGLLPLAGLISFVLALVIVLRGRGGMSSTALLLVVPLPFLVGIFGAIHGLISSYSVIAAGGSTVKAAEVASGISLSLVAPLLGMLLMAPSYIVALVGSLVRSFAPPDRTPDK